MNDQDALGGAKFGGGLYLKDFPAKIRVLTLDPMVYNDPKFATTHYVFIIFNLEEGKVQIWDTTGGNASALQAIHLDPDFGGNLRGIDVKVLTNGKQGKERRYTIQTVGAPHNLTQEQLEIIRDNPINLEEKVRSRNPGALRLSDINSGKKLSSEESIPVVEDDDDIDLSQIPF